jgi:hypothetical protein
MTATPKPWSLQQPIKYPTRRWRSSLHPRLAPTELEIPKKTDTSNKYQPSEKVQVKAIDLATDNNNNTIMIGTGLDPK